MIYMAQPWSSIISEEGFVPFKLYTRISLDLDNFKCGVVVQENFINQNGSHRWRFVARSIDPCYEEHSSTFTFKSKEEAMAACDKKLIEFGWKLLSQKHLLLLDSLG
jgi:hypothetical protein